MLFRQNLRTGSVEALSARRDKSHSPLWFRLDPGITRPNWSVDMSNLVGRLELAHRMICKQTVKWKSIWNRTEGHRKEASAGELSSWPCAYVKKNMANNYQDDIIACILLSESLSNTKDFKLHKWDQPHSLKVRALCNDWLNEAYVPFSFLVIPLSAFFFVKDTFTTFS